VRAAVRARGLQPIVFDLRGQVASQAARALTTLASASRLLVLDLSDAGRPPEALVSSLRAMKTSTLPVAMQGRGTEWREIQEWRADGTNMLPFEQYADAAELARAVDRALPR